MIKIAIVDDHAIMRSGLKKILLEEPDMEVVVEASGHSQLLRSLRGAQPDVLVLDISLRGKNGLDILKEIKQQYSGIRTLMLSMHPEERFSVRAIRAGACGYVTKDSAVEELVHAIRQVHNGGKYITPAVAELLANSFVTDVEKPPHDLLSNREFQVLGMISSGKKIADIAAELSISRSTVATYRARILEKLQLKSNVELANYAIRHNLVD
jgi:two-component system, NarL family, invasion response regulator UvrY